MKMRERFERSGAVVLAGLCMLLGGLMSAQAAVVTVDATNSYQDVGLVSGLDRAFNPFDIGAAGAYEVRLTDFAFPTDPFDALHLIVTSATEELGRLDGPGSFLFTADPGHYFVSLVWDSAGEFDIGLYGIQIASSGGATSVVPIPSSVVMLLSAIGLLAFLRYRRRRNLHDTPDFAPYSAGAAWAH